MKEKQTKWIKKRHAFIFKTLSPLFKLHFKVKYNLEAFPCEDKVPHPALIMSNHLTTMDPFMMALSFKRPIYYITSDDLFTIPVVSPIIKWLVAPIPKAKSKSDLNTVRSTLKVLKEGGTVAVFPEGNRSLSGGSWHIDVSTAKLVKMSKVPLVLYNIKGGYGADPRWGKAVRKGKVTCDMVKIISAEDIAKMSVEEIYKEIVDNLVSNDFESGVKFKSKSRAEFLERALYFCPKCKSFNTLYSHKEKLYCKCCDFSTEYTEDLQFKNLGDRPYGANVKEWFDNQLKALERYSKEKKGKLFGDNCVEARLVYDGKRHKLGRADIASEKDKVIVTLKNGTVHKAEFDGIYGVTVVGKRKINFYLPGDKTLQIKGSKRFNGVKYLHLYELYKKES